MGNVQVDYKPKRGSFDEDKAYFEMILLENFAQSQQLYNGATADQRRRADEIFGKNIFGESWKAEMWFNNNESPSALAEAREKLATLLA